MSIWRSHCSSGSQAHFEMNGGSIENNKSTVPGRSQYSAPVTAVEAPLSL